MNITVRKYISNDRKKIEEALERFQHYLVSTDPLKHLIRTAGYGGKYTAQLLKKLKSKKGIMFVAMDGGILARFAAGALENQTKMEALGTVPMKYGRLEELYLDEKYRGKGIGRKLIEKIEFFFNENKCDVALIEVFGPNKNAHSFYKKMGYTNRNYEMMKKIV